MGMYRSKRYEEIRDQVGEDYLRPNPMGWAKHARRWVSRVGLVRLTAAEAATEASGLLRSINLTTYRNEPELADLLARARAASQEFSLAAAQANWERFEGES